jgi:iron complex outermembrane receptor protein
LAISLKTQLWGTEIQGVIIEAKTRAPIGGVFVAVEDSSEFLITQSDGLFGFSSIDSTVIVLTAHRTGYNTVIDTFLVNKKRLSVEIIMHPQVTELDETIVVGSSFNSGTTEPVTKMRRSEVRGRIKNTLAETLSNQAGFAQRSSGPATARPVLRGMSDARLLVLEDGQNTGDLSASSPDHAIIIEPMATDNVTVVRGPETVRYGSSALVGVINSKKNLIPDSHPDRWIGNVAFSGATINSGWANNARLEGALGQFIVHTDLVARQSEDTKTPIGTLKNTFSKATNYAVGMGKINDSKKFGVAISQYNSNYGVTGDAEKGHPNGVEIEIERRRIEYEVTLPAKVLQYNKKPVEWFHAFTRYKHAEIESSGLVGTEFGLVTMGGGLRIPNNMGESGFLYEYRDYASGGFSLTPPTREYAGGLYSFRNWQYDDWKFISSLRLDIRQIIPRTDRVSTIGNVEDKTFHGFSGGGSLQYKPAKEWDISITWMRSYRPPSVEELFSGGPHLGTYSYEVGNPRLDAETGSGIELATAWVTPNLRIKLVLFQNKYDGFLYMKNTGTMSLRRADLPLYQVHNQNARFRGIENELKFPLNKYINIFTTLSYINGTFTSFSKQPVPQMPPLLWQAGLTWSHDPLNLRFTSRGAAKQSRLGGFEEPTNAYQVFDFDIQYHFFKQKRLNTLKFVINNVTDSVYRNHLNRLKSIMPEPGRDARLLYQIYF